MVRKVYMWLFRHHTRRKTRNTFITIKEAKAERERLYKLLGTISVNSWDFDKTAIRIKAIDSLLYHFFVSDKLSSAWTGWTRDEPKN